MGNNLLIEDEAKKQRVAAARAAQEDLLRKAASQMDAPALTPINSGGFENTTELLSGIVYLSDVHPGPVRWLWEPYMRKGTISILRGDPSCGKTFVFCALMAAIASDEQPAEMPGKLHTHNGRCIYFGEEEVEEICGRIRELGVEPSKNMMFFKDSISFQDTDKLQALINYTGADLIIFDPIQSYLGAKVDMHKANEVRPVLDKLQQIARETGCAILIIEHLNKDQKGKKKIYRGIGSMDITAAARSVLMIEEDPEDENTRYIFHIKTNKKQGPGIIFRIEDGRQCGRFVWCGATDPRGNELRARQDLSGRPAVKLARSILKKHPEGFGGTIAKLINECPELNTPVGAENYNMSLGHELSDPELRQKIEAAFGICIDITRPGNRTTYHIYAK